jgi:hypothetical protein
MEKSTGQGNPARRWEPRKWKAIVSRGNLWFLELFSSRKGFSFSLSCSNQKWNRKLLRFFRLFV